MRGCLPAGRMSRDEGPESPEVRGRAGEPKDLMRTGVWLELRGLGREGRGGPTGHRLWGGCPVMLHLLLPTAVLLIRSIPLEEPHIKARLLFDVQRPPGASEGREAGRPSRGAACSVPVCRLRSPCWHQVPWGRIAREDAWLEPLRAQRALCWPLGGRRRGLWYDWPVFCPGSCCLSQLGGTGPPCCPDPSPLAPGSCLLEGIFCD